MDAETELFSQARDFKPDFTKTEPLIWVREMRILHKLAPGEANVIRSIKLHLGLNILWAKPRQRSGSAQQSTRGIPGHASGKTLFCRFLRHLLGEPNFGTDDQRSRIRQTFPDGWIVGEVRLANETWLIARPFKSGAHPFAIRGHGLEALFNDHLLQIPVDDYTKELTRILVESLPVTTFASLPATKIKWEHLLEWLTRDQECRFAGLADLRHSSSDHESPKMSVEDTHFLFRAVTNTIDTFEQRELETNRTLLSEKQTAEKRVPLLRFRGESSLKVLHDARENLFSGDFDVDEEMRRQLCCKLADIHSEVNGQEDLFLDAAMRRLNETAILLKKQQQEMPVPEALQEARRNLAKGETAKRKAQEDVEAIEDSVEFINKKLEVLAGAAPQSSLDAWVLKKMKNGRLCMEPLSAAIEWDCPLNRSRKLPIEQKTPALPTQETQEHLQQQKTGELQRLAKAKEVLATRTEELSHLKATEKAATEAFDAARAKLGDAATLWTNISNDAKRAISDAKEAADLEQAITKLEGQIEDSQKRQAAFRERQSEALGAFSDTFRRVVCAVVDEDVTGTIQFRGRLIRPTFQRGIDLSSAAIDTLKVICFDLTSLINGVEGRGYHPRFLIHDGPREADMDALLYQNLFLAIRKLEQDFRGAPLSFQYIITTTEPPPDVMQKPEWVIEPPLNADIPAGRLLGKDF